MRNQALRARQAKGYVVLKVEVDEVALAETLVLAGLLDPTRVDDRACLEAALSALIGDWCAA